LPQVTQVTSTTGRGFFFCLRYSLACLQASDQHLGVAPLRLVGRNTTPHSMQCFGSRTRVGGARLAVLRYRFRSAFLRQASEQKRLSRRQRLKGAPHRSHCGSAALAQVSVLCIGGCYPRLPAGQPTLFSSILLRISFCFAFPIGQFLEWNLWNLFSAFSDSMF